MNKKISFIIVIVLLLIIGGFVFIKRPFGDNEKINNVSDKSKEINNIEDNSEDNLNKDIIGKWETVKAVNSIDGKETNNLRDVFGSSYATYGSYLELKDDGTFFDAIKPITNGSEPNTGKYRIVNDYNKVGDCYVFLEYSNGNEKTIQKIYLDDSNIPYLVLDDFVNDYQLYLKK